MEVTLSYMLRWEDSIRVFVEDTGWEGMNGSNLAKNRDQL
jgi:hypothetical protein